MMRKKMILVVALVLAVVLILTLMTEERDEASEQELTENGGISFQCENLEAVVRRTINKPAGEITEEDMLELTSLCSFTTRLRREIKSLSGLEYATNLTELKFGQNHLTDLTPLVGLTNLTELWLYNNRLADLTPLAGLTNLTVLLLSDNRLTDLTPLMGLTNLISLRLSGNPLSEAATQDVEILRARGVDVSY